MHYRYLFCCFLIFIQLASPGTGYKARGADLEPRSHVIVLIDIGSSMDEHAEFLRQYRVELYRDSLRQKLASQQKAITEDLKTVLFQGKEVLYRPKRDCVSILFFGIEWGQKFSDNYIHPYSMHNSFFFGKDLLNVYRERRKFSGRYWSAPNTARYYGLYKTSADGTTESKRYNKTYLVTLTSKRFSNDPKKELRDLETKARIGETDKALGICQSIRKLYDLESVSELGAHGQQIEVHEVVVKHRPDELPTGLPGHILLERRAGNVYARRLNLFTSDVQEHVKPSSKYRISQIAYQIVDESDSSHVIQETVILGADESHVVDIQLGGEYRDNGNLEIQLEYFFLFADSYYGNQIVETQKKIEIMFEPIEHIWDFIPIPDFLMSVHAARDQDEIKKIYDIGGLIFLIIAGTGLLSFGGYRTWTAVRPEARPVWDFIPADVDQKLDFNQSDREPVKIGTVTVSNDVKGWYKIKKKFRVDLAAAVQMPDYMVTSGDRFLFFEKRERIYDLRVARPVSVDVYLYLSSIDDCSEPSLTEAEIPFTLTAEMKVKGEKGLTNEKDGVVRLGLVREVTEPDISLRIDHESIEHKYGEKSIFGELTIASKAQKTYSEPLNTTLGLAIVGKPELMNGLFFRASDPDDDRVEHSDSAPGMVRIRDLKKGEALSLNAGVDFSVISNPRFPSDVHQFQIVDDANMAFGNWRIVILRDSTAPEFLAEVCQEGEQIYQFDGKTHKPDVISIEKPRIEDVVQSEICELIIGNSATSGDGYVLVDGRVSKVRSTTEEDYADFFAKIRQGKSTDSAEADSDADQEADPLERILVTEDSKPLRDLVISSKRIANNAPPYSVRICARYDQIDSEEVLPEEISFDVESSFDYKLYDTDGQMIRAEQLILSLRLILGKDLGAYWLSIDCGTSAISCAFDDNTRDARLLDLQEQFVKNEGPPQNAEAGTPFIRAMIMLNRRESAGSKGFVSMEFLESAPAMFPSEIVPYLKKIIGYDRVPLPKPLSYIEADGSEVEGMPRVIDVLTSLYMKIVTDYVIESIEPEKREPYLNKVMVSVPNTFTSKHIDLLRNILHGNFGDRFREIDFISESDAVACYYIDNWQRLNRERNETDREFLATNDEHVLVYDAGAGTLDITYLKIHKDESGPTQIEILNKLGKSTGGNNLDTILARIILEKLSEIEEAQESEAVEMLFRELYQTSDEGKQAMVNLKFQIRDKVKLEYSRLYGTGSEEPIQVSVGDIITGLRGNVLEIKPDEIASHPYIQPYIAKNTSDILDQFFDVLGREPQQTPIDTVILSGRGTLFGGFKEGIQKAVEKWADPARQPYYPTLEEAELKSSVCLGALAYALTWRSHKSIRFVDRNVWAKYGILHRDGTGRWRFDKLISPDLDDTSDVGESSDRVRATREYEGAETVDFANTDKIRFIQTYSRDPAKDFSEGDYGLITFLCEANKNRWPERKLHLAAKIDKETKLTLKIQGDVWERDLSYVDLEKDEGYRKGLWPFL